MTIRRQLLHAGAALAVCIGTALVAQSIGAQELPAAARRPFEPPKTAWGDPDLQGTWPSGPLIDVPFERSPALGTRAVLTDAEFAARAAQLQAVVLDDQAPSPTPSAAPALTAASHWLERGRASRQASLVVDPPDGRLPPMTEDGARRAARWRETADPAYLYERAQDFRLYDRCITRGVLGSTFPNIYSSGMALMQIPGAVVIRYEMIHEVRVIPLDGRPHVPTAIRSYMGDARGRWEGSTLVVETTNFSVGTGTYGRNGDGNPTSADLRLVERFSLLDRDTLHYEVTVHDPPTWARPWTVAFPLARDDDYEMYEYACHEGNYAIANMLRAARAAEKGF